MKPRIVFIEQFYYPEGWGGAELPRMLTSYLARRNLDVEVICGGDLYSAVEDPHCEDPRASGVRIRRTPRLFAGGIHRFKLLRQLWFYAASTPILLFRRRPDLLILQTNPPLGIVVGAFAARLWRRPLVIIAMDIYPEVVAAHGSLGRGSFLYRLLDGMFRWAYRSATRVVALGPVMAERLIAKGVEPNRIEEISNWSTGAAGVLRGSANPLLQSLGFHDRFVVGYSGNLGIGHEFETFLRGFAAALRDAPQLALVFIGRGNRLAEVKATAASLGIQDSVRFLDFLPAERMPEGLGIADVALVTLREGFEGLIVPSKLYSYLSRGIPVFYVGPRSDAEVLIDSVGCGVTARNGDVEGVRTALLRLSADRAVTANLGVTGQTCYEHSLTADHSLAKYAALVERTLAGR